jgi:hypothetical protein
MPFSTRLVVLTLWVMSLIVVGILAQAQAPLRPAPLPPAPLPPAPGQTPLPPTTAPIVVSGNDIGFRIEGQSGGNPIGTLVIRINGVWVEAKSPAGVRRLTAQ